MCASLGAFLRPHAEESHGRGSEREAIGMPRKTPAAGWGYSVYFVILGENDESSSSSSLHQALQPLQALPIQSRCETSDPVWTRLSRACSRRFSTLHYSLVVSCFPSACVQRGAHQYVDRRRSRFESIRFRHDVMAVGLCTARRSVSRTRYECLRHLIPASGS